MDRQLFNNLSPPTTRTRKKQTIFIVLSFTVHLVLFAGFMFLPPPKKTVVSEPKLIVTTINFYSEPSLPPSLPPKGALSPKESSPKIKTIEPEKPSSQPEKPVPTEAPGILKPELQNPPSISPGSTGPPGPPAPPNTTIGSESGKPGGKIEIVQGLEITGGSVNPLGPFRPGGNVKDPVRIYYVEPAYPKAAIAAKIEGTVILEAVIGKDGKIKNVKIIKSLNPLLDQTAVEAIRQWRYTPSTLAGRPIEILLTVIFNFKIK